MDTDQTGLETRRRRAIYRASYRGFREADLILKPFAIRYCPTMSEADLEVFEVLLEINDHDLFGWIIERDEVPTEYKSGILNQIIEFHRTVYVEVRGVAS